MVGTLCARLEERKREGDKENEAPEKGHKKDKTKVCLVGVARLHAGSGASFFISCYSIMTRFTRLCVFRICPVAVGERQSTSFTQACLRDDTQCFGGVP